MKMAKASSRDIDAAGDAMGVLSDISKGYYPDRTGGDEDRPFYFDEEDPAHLRLFYDLINDGWVRQFEKSQSNQLLNDFAICLVALD